MSADLASQKGLRNRLIGAPAVLALVPAANIIDRHTRPVPLPSIILGETQEIEDTAAVQGNRSTIVHTVHVWVAEPSTEGAKRVAAAMFAALKGPRLQLDAPYSCAGLWTYATRFLRDPRGDLSHGILTVEMLVQDTSR